MSCNRERPHILILPEDDANREIANGFHRQIEIGRQRQLQIMPVCGGWRKVVDEFRRNYVGYLTKYITGNVILLIDFDRDERRFHEVFSEIPDQFKERTFIFGSWDEPQSIGLGQLENVGGLLADDCRHNTSTAWSHDMFLHNSNEVSRLRASVCDIIF